MADVRMLLTHWQKTPPLHVSVAGFFGIGKQDESVRPSTMDEVQQFVNDFKQSRST